MQSAEAAEIEALERRLRVVRARQSARSQVVRERERALAQKEARIRALEDENASLRKRVAALATPTDMRRGNEDVEVRETGDAALGMGLYARRDLARHAWLLRYEGDDITEADANAREAVYDARGDTRSYMFFYTARPGGETRCIDATEYTHSLARYANHSRRAPNMAARWHRGGIWFFTLRAIRAGEELRFDYGVRDSAALADNPWLRE